MWKWTHVSSRSNRRRERADPSLVILAIVRELPIEILPTVDKRPLIRAEPAADIEELSLRMKPQTMRYQNNFH